MPRLESRQNPAGLGEEGTSSKYGSKRCGEKPNFTYIYGFRVADKRWTRQLQIAKGIGIVITFPGSQLPMT